MLAAEAGLGLWQSLGIFSVLLCNLVFYFRLESVMSVGVAMRLRIVLWMVATPSVMVAFPFRSDTLESPASFLLDFGLSWFGLALVADVVRALSVDSSLKPVFFVGVLR
ncbi:hypothetical protein GOP47_0003459 [Adiantum capillus-veneris]|uniref:Uncharacterized protein n=1 Tax=Adiantum capillus-veneris TaxID=13818 RepID=A0A9D4VC04_ADICA|nr:hypothetical protein GOP47_0003459 [Adiantum capillus-veneris]